MSITSIKQLAGILVIVAISLFLSGCALLQIPLKVLDLATVVAQGAIDIASKLPMPPPWLFF